MRRCLDLRISRRGGWFSAQFMVKLCGELDFRRFRVGILRTFLEKTACQGGWVRALFPTFVMKAEIHPKYQDAEIRCACGNVIKTRSIKPSILIGICNVCHPFYTGTQKFVDTAGRVDKYQQRLAKTAAVQKEQAEAAGKKKKK